MPAAEVVAPIVILGSPRSGTTFLADLLGGHPSVCRSREARLAWRFGNDGHTDELDPARARPEVVQHIRRHFAELVDGQGGGRLIEKTPANSVRPSFVRAVFPDAYFVHITRDGWSNVPVLGEFWGRRSTGLDAKQRAKARRRLQEASPRQIPHYARELLTRAVRPQGHRAQLYGPRLAGLQQVADELGVLGAAAFQWRECVVRATSFGRYVDPSRYVELKLESLDVEGIERLLAFCDLAPSPELLDTFTATYDPVLATRRPELSEADRTQVAGFIEPTNAWLGYPTG